MVIAKWRKKYIQDGLAIDDSWAPGYVAMAGIQRREGGMGQAILVFHQGLEKAPESGLLMLSLASAYESQENYEEAKKYYEMLVSRSPNNGIAVNNLANLLVEQFESPDNIKRAKEIVSIFESSSQPFFLDTYGWVLAKSEEFSEAEAVMERVVSLKSDEPVFQYHYAYVLSNNGQAEKARNVINRYADERMDADLRARFQALKEKLEKG